MLLLVDTNEQATNKKVVADLRKNFSQVIVSKLKAGDVNIPLDSGEVLAIERKDPGDFLNSIVDGRIFEQVENMAKFAKYSAFIVTGKFMYKDKSDIVVIEREAGNEETRDKWRGSSVRNTMTAIMFSGCPVIFCPPSKYCMMISELYTLVNRPDEHRGIHKNRIITFPPIDPPTNFIAQLPGIGLKLAESMMSFTNMMDFGEDQGQLPNISSAFQYMTTLMAIDKASRPAGWGQAKVFAIRKFLGLEPDEYLSKVKEVEITDYDGKANTAVEINGALYVKVDKAKISKSKGKITIAPF